MSRLESPGPATKRIKLDNLVSQVNNVQAFEEPMADTEQGEMIVEDVNNAVEEEEDENSCSICLHSIVDRTMVPKCSHEFCFECLLVWTEQSRRCPLCSQAIGEYLIHSIRSRYDYRKHYLSPLRTSPPPSRPAQTVLMQQTARRNARRRHRDVEWGTRASRVREHEEFDKLERSILKRRWIYEHDLYAKHVASNSFTKYRPYPTPSQFAASQELISRTTSFLRRELQVWENLDVEFLTNLIISLMKSIDIRSESAVKLIAEFLDLDAPYTAGGRHVNAEHFAHEVYCYVRSPYRDLFVYDKVVQYDLPQNIPPPPELERSRRWHPSSPSPSHPIAESSHANDSRRLRSTSRSSERSESWSPSGRRYSSSRNRATFFEHGTSRRESEGDKSHRHPNNAACQDKGRKHHINIPADKILDDIETKTCGNSSSTPCSSNSLVNPSSLTRNNSDNHVDFEKARRDLKGKGRAHEPRMTNQAQSAGPPIEHSQSTLKLTAPVETLEPNDVCHSAEKTPISDRPSIPPPLKQPRNTSLVDSVKAHLARNPGFSINPDRISGPNVHRLSANTKSSATASASFSPLSRDQNGNAPPNSNPISQVPSLSSGYLEESRFVDISRVECQPSNDVRSNKREENLRGGNPSDPSSTSLEQIQLSATGVTETPQIDSSSQHDGTVSSGNGVVPFNAITDAPGQPSSSNVSLIFPEHNICAVEAKPSRLEESASIKLSSHRLALEMDSSSTRDIEASASNSAFILEDQSKNALQVHDVQGSPSNMADSPIRNDASIDTASITSTIVNQLAIPRATTNTRTRLLARLAHEKSKASACAPVLNHGAEPRVLRDRAPPKASSSVNVELKDSVPPPIADDKTSGSALPERNTGAVNLQEWLRANPNAGSAGEDVKAREVKLRARLQLNARLTAEKRKVGGS